MAVSSEEVQLPSKIPNKRKTVSPASKVAKGSAIRREDASAYMQSIDSLRRTGRTLDAIEELSFIDGTVSSAVSTFVSIANSGHGMEVFDTKTHQLSPEGMSAVSSISASLNTLYDYTKGFASKKPISAIIETHLREVLLTGGCAQELVLDKFRSPERLEPVAMSQLKWVSKGNGEVFPRQEVTGNDPVDLNIATFFVAESRKSPMSMYARSMLESALTTTFMFDEFMEDVRRVLRQSGHSRLALKLDTEKIKATADKKVQNNAAELQSYLTSARTSVEEIINSLAPEDALVFFDSVEADMLKTDIAGGADYTPMLKYMTGVLATSLKIHPSILGIRLDGSQSLSNTESLVFLKTAKSLHQPVETIMSRALTLAARLLGLDVYVHFRFKPISLRPDDELQAFYTMRDNRILQLLSLGFISDDQAAFELGTGMRPEGSPELSGTMFYSSPTGEAAKEPSPNDDPQGRALQPDTPTKAGGESQ